MRTLSTLIMLITLTLLGASPASAEYQPLERYTLGNGLEIGVQGDPEREFVAVCLVYRVGWGDAPIGHRGLAHVTEHLMFAGTPTYPDGYFAALEPAGATHINASTSRDRTTYCTEVPSEALEVALHAEADRMAYMLAHVDQSHVDTQLEVVLNEFAERGGGAPGSNIAIAEVERLYPSGHPFRRISSGTGPRTPRSSSPADSPPRRPADGWSATSAPSVAADLRHAPRARCRCRPRSGVSSSTRR